MYTPAELWKQVVQTMKSSPRQTPSTLMIPRNHIDENLAGQLDSPFQKDQHYFQVLVNEMYLTNQREWLNTIDPVVYAVSEFIYNGKPQIIPFLVGPTLIKELGIQDPYTNGIILRNTSISGLHPYRGGGLTLTVILCEAKSGNVVRPLLDVIQNVVKALDFSPVLSQYVKIADVVVEGFESL